MVWLLAAISLPIFLLDADCTAAASLLRDADRLHPMDRCGLSHGSGP